MKPFSGYIFFQMPEKREENKSNYWNISVKEKLMYFIYG